MAPRDVVIPAVGQIVDYQMSAMVLQLLRVPLRAIPITRPKFPLTPASTPEIASSIDGPYGFNPQQLCRDQKRIRGGLPGKTLRIDRVAVDPHLEEVG